MKISETFVNGKMVCTASGYAPDGTQIIVSDSQDESGVNTRRARVIAGYNTRYVAHSERLTSPAPPEANPRAGPANQS